MDNKIDTLVLSGEGPNAFATLGAIQFLIDKNKLQLKNINHYFGTSSGAILSYLFIIGYTPIEILLYILKIKNLFKKDSSSSILSILNGSGYYNFDIIRNELKILTLKKIDKVPTFKELYEKFNKSFTCMTYNLTLGKHTLLSHETFPELNCLTGLQMTSALPYIFQKCIYNTFHYVDGFFYNNFIIDIIPETQYKSTIGIYIEKINIKPTDFIFKILHLLYVQLKTNMSLRLQNVSPKLKENIFLVKHVNTMTYTLFSNLNKSNIMNLFQHGYENIENNLNKK